MHLTTINEKGGREFEREKGEISVRVWSEERKEGDGVIILKPQK